MFLFSIRKKTFAVHHFLTPKNYFVEAHFKQMSVYFYISKVRLWLNFPKASYGPVEVIQYTIVINFRFE